MTGIDSGIYGKYYRKFWDQVECVYMLLEIGNAFISECAMLVYFSFILLHTLPQSLSLSPSLSRFAC